MTYVSMQDMAGKLVVDFTGDESRLTIDTQDLHNGVYILKVTLESDEQVVEKVVVQN